MADEEKTEETEPTKAAEEQAPDAPDAPEAEGGDAPEKEAPAKEAPPKDAAPAPAAGGDAEPAEALTPKQLRKQKRAEHSGEAADARTPEQRAADRGEARKTKAASRSRYRAAQRAKKGEAGTGTPAAERVDGPKKIRQGIVTSSKADKTITVQVESARRHPAYEKIVRRSRSLHAHDESNEAGEGDTVRIIETRPMSKSKRWRLVEVVEKAE